MDKETIGKYIKQRRKELNVTQPVLATLSGIGLNTLVAIERGAGNPQIDTLNTVLDTLGLQLNISLKD